MHTMHYCDKFSFFPSFLQKGAFVVSFYTFTYCTYIASLEELACQNKHRQKPSLSLQALNSTLVFTNEKEERKEEKQWLEFQFEGSSFMEEVEEKEKERKGKLLGSSSTCRNGREKRSFENESPLLRTRKMRAFKPAIFFSPTHYAVRVVPIGSSERKKFFKTI